jgi:glycosyltransferase involved in cell wall biosynthesis
VSAEGVSPRAAGREQDAGAPPIRLCIMTTVGMTIQILYEERLEYLQEHGFAVTVVCAPSEYDEAIRGRGVRLHTVPLSRTLSPWRDLRALWQLARFLRREPFDLVEVSTGKAALLGAIAARLAGVACLIHVLRGLLLDTTSGVAWPFAWLMQAVPCWLAHHNLSVSESLREAAHRHRVCNRRRSRVVGPGSYKGVDLERFNPQQRARGAAVRARHGIPADAVVFGFVGRLTRDKGLIELATAFSAAARTDPALLLLLVGGYEQRDRPPPDVVALLAAHPQVRNVGWQTDIPGYLAAMDVLVLPSYREGFPNTPLEAAAMGLPVITTDATGCRDAVRDGITGIRVPVRDAEQLRAAMERLAGDAELRQRLGTAGRRWVTECFDQAQVFALYADEYRRLARQKPSDVVGIAEREVPIRNARERSG